MAVSAIFWPWATSVGPKSAVLSAIFWTHPHSTSFPNASCTRGLSHRTRKWREAETWSLCSWPDGDASALVSDDHRLWATTIGDTPHRPRENNVTHNVAALH